MKENIFSGLEELGFTDIKDMDVFDKNKEDKEKTIKKEKEEDPRDMLYDASSSCPVCGNKFQSKAVKSSAYRRQKNDSDFFIRYASINPYFYEVWLCNSCGYAALKQDFEKIRDFQVELVKSKIAPRWQGRQYPELYDAKIAIERYKLALLNSVVMEAKASRKALICLRTAWMFRLLEDSANELIFLKQALEGFNNAYSNEDFPISGMDRFTVMYLLGELNRRIGDFNEANLWFSKVITAPSCPQKIKDIARDQRDVIKEEAQKLVENPEDVTQEQSKKTGFFSKFFR